MAEDQAAGELVVAWELVAAELAEVAALGGWGAVELVGLLVPAYGNLVVRRAVEVARGQAPVATVVEVERGVGLDQEPAAEVARGQAPVATVVEVERGVGLDQEPEAALQLQVASPCRLESG